MADSNNLGRFAKRMKAENKNKILKRLQEIRIELTGIYLHELGNPLWLEADSRLNADIHNIEKNVMLDKPELKERTEVVLQKHGE